MIDKLKKMSRRKLANQWQQLKNSEPSNISAAPIDPNNLLHWRCNITGANSTLFEGIILELDVLFPEDYPFRPPRIKFVNPIFHPNVDLETKQLHLSIFREDWSPALTVEKLFLTISSVIHEPLIDLATANDLAAKIYESDRSSYEQIVTEYNSNNSAKKK